MRKGTKIIAAMLTGIILSLLGIEGVLRAFDPLGMGVYFHDLALVLNSFVKPNDARPFVLPDGAVILRYWRYTIQDGIRQVPDTKRRSQCTIVVTGDSVTFGFGVNDSETFVNLLARRFPLVRFVNVAQTGYNIWDNAQAIERYAGQSGYIYLLTNNDDEATFRIPMRVAWPDGGLALHLSYNPSFVPRKYKDSFYAKLRELQARNDVLIIGFAPDQIIARNIPIYTHWVSRFDAHPGVKGHEQIANSMVPYVKAFIRERCRQ